jgi:hypothetical protein
MAGIYLFIMVMSTTMFAIQEKIGPVEETTAYKLFNIEKEARTVPAEAEKLLRDVLNDATTMAVKKNRHPRTKAEALAVFEAIQLALVKHNFVQPPEERDWPQTIGIAFKPLSLAPEAQEDVLAFSVNRLRKNYLDSGKPLYFVDCDMGSQLFMAIGERLGWDIRLVELPQHNFVRWHLSESVKVNWDWVAGKSIDDSAYFQTLPATEDSRLTALYMRSLEAKEAWAYYLGLIGSEAARPQDGERLLREAVTVLPNHPLTLNNLAWLYATTPEFAKNKSDVAVAYSLAAWSMRPYHGNFADTVACSFAANGKKAIAEKIEEFAIEHPNNERQRQGFRNNLARIRAGQLCQ